MPVLHRATWYPGEKRPRRGNARRAAVAAFAGVSLLVPAAAFGRAPAAPELVAAGANVSFLSAEGLASNALVHAEVWRSGVRIGLTNSITPVSDPVNVGRFLAEFNHLGEPGCWLNTTPQFRPGDLLRVVRETTPTPDVIQTTLNHIVAQPPFAAAPSAVQMLGEAATPGGVALPVAQLEVLIRENGNGLRLLAPGQGIITSNAPGSVAWTATFSGLTADEVSRAVNAPRVEAAWISPAGTEIHFYEVGAIPGPAGPPCTAPLQAGPTIGLAAASDSGALGDRVTSDPTPTVTGVVSVPVADKPVNIYLNADVTTPIASTTAGADGVYSITLPALPDGVSTLTAAEVDAGPVETTGNSPLVLTVDTLAPAAPSGLQTSPASPANNNAPKVLGAAEVGSTVTLYVNNACTLAAPPPASGSAATFATPGIATAVTDNTTTTFFARTTDIAGNPSSCSASGVPYVEDSIPPAVPSISPKRNGDATNDDPVSIAFTPTSPQNGDILECRLVTPANPNPAFAGCTSPFEAGAPTDGTYTFTVRTRDLAGNPSPSDSDSFVKDATPPAQPSITSTSPASPSNVNTPLVIGTAEAGSTVDLYDGAVCTGGPEATGTAAQFAAPGLQASVTANSTRQFRVRATDAAGNVSQCSAPFAYTEDSIAPAAPAITQITPAGASAPRVVGTAEAGSTVRVYITGNCTGSPAPGPQSDFSGTGIQVVFTHNGANQVSATATDAAGNTSPCLTPPVQFLVADGIAPVVTITGNPPASSEDATPTFGFVSDEVNSTFECAVTLVGGGPVYVPCASGATFGPLNPGNYIFWVRGTDTVGNLGSPTTFAFSVVAPPPPASTQGSGSAPLLSRASLPPPPPAAARAVPVTRGARLRLDGRIAITIRCSGPVGSSCRGRVSLVDVRTGAGLGSGRFAMQAGRRISVRISLPRAYRAKLMRGSRFAARAVVDAGGRITAVGLALRA